MARYIFITGGVVSSLGKGIASASLGALLQSLGYSVRLRKLDPYLNVDPGTMSPYQHGEVFVTDDGAETDLDIGHYERFTGVNAFSSDSVSAGFIYWNVLQQERQGLYLGSTIQVIPHITDAIKDFIARDITDEDFVLCEIGGTVGDIESTPFLEAARQFSQGQRSSVLFIHVTLLPYIAAAGEIKTKPTQHSVKELLRHGIQPDILLCRSELPISVRDKEKISLFCNVAPSCVIAAYTAKHIYDVPRAYHAEGLDIEVLRYFDLPVREADLSRWGTIVDRVLHPAHGTVRVKLVGKYIALLDAYKSVFEALTHAGIANTVSVIVDLVDSSVDDMNLLDSQLADADAILIPGGYGERGIEGKMRAITYARVHGIPFLGICFGMQLAIIEFARHVLGINDATSSEFGSSGTPIVGLITEFTSEFGVQHRHSDSDLGGTQRLGAYDALLTEGTQVYTIYDSSRISERHRHRYEIDISYADSFAKHGLIFSGVSPDGRLPEVLEYKQHPWFIAVQFHPELKSRPFAPHPLFVSFISASLIYRNSRLEL